MLTTCNLINYRGMFVVLIGLGLVGCVTADQKRINEAVKKMSSRTSEECGELEDRKSYYKWVECRKSIINSEMPSSYRAFHVLQEHMINITELALKADKESMPLPEFKVALEREKLNFRNKEREYLKGLAAEARKRNAEKRKRWDDYLESVQPKTTTSPSKTTNCNFHNSGMTCTEN